MLNGATQHSYTDPFDTTSPAIPIGLHWMLIWPFDPKAAGLGSVMRDTGTMVMFAGSRDTERPDLHVWTDDRRAPANRTGGSARVTHSLSAVRSASPRKSQTKSQRRPTSGDTQLRQATVKPGQVPTERH
jgi:hypothetical protein